MIEYSIEEKHIKVINGYEIIFDLNHPLVNKSGYVYVHRHVMSIKLGRWILPTEFVHHIDGDRSNNNPDNLELTTRRKHAAYHFDNGGLSQKTPRITETRICLLCGKEYKQSTRRRGNFYCSEECHRKDKRKFEISKEELERLVWEKPTVQLAKEIGCSDKAIGNRCKKLGIQKPPPGYWRKVETGKI